ncbi:conserved protein of unknown function (plasmid) [Rhodovastum atsumiense]|uniref:hypothetical protein n=1 Tax=Rhodovastum atsumiense TaxID=504468 RepID=UPI0020245E62|nr:hypothetical protein [Rhodovastum atsumiense]CAH2605531.1 conserved protein of unknown function [Rhodovastum atsumiense]
MSRRFIPPAIAAFGEGPEAEQARALARAREDGFAEGRVRGQAEGHAAGLVEGIERARAEAAVEIQALQRRCAETAAPGAVLAALQKVLRTQADDLAALEAASAAAVDAALACLFPVLLQSGAGAEVAAITRTALAERTPATLKLRAHPATLAATATELAAQTAAGHLILNPDANLPEGAAEISWTGGGLAFDPHELLLRVRATLRPPEDTPT